VPGVAAPEGAAQALMGTAGVEDLTLVDEVLGLPPGALEVFDAHLAARASAISQVVSAPAGSTLSFRWNFLTNEPSTGFDDFSFFALGGTLHTLGDAFGALAAALPASGFARQTGFQTASLDLPSGGTFVLGFGAADEGAPGLDSALLVDDVRIGRVSLPATPALVGVAMLCLVLLRARGLGAREGAPARRV
jgi:hypothetical protein